MDMADRYVTTRNNHVVWWALGAIAVLAILWALAHSLSNNGAGIPNTGVDDNASTTDNSGMYLNASSSSMEVKG